MTQTNFFNSLTSSNRSIVASAQKKGLPFIDFDDLQNQLLPRKLMIPLPLDNPVKLPGETRLSLSSLESFQKEGPTPKKKTVAFREENEILESPKNASRGGLETEPEKKPTLRIQKGILVKRKRYNDAGVHHHQNDRKYIDGVKNPSQEDTGAGNREVLESQKTEIDEMRSPVLLMGGENLMNNLMKRNFPGLEALKKGSATENTEVTQEEPYLKTDSLAQSFRKKFEMPREDYSSRKVLATLFSPKLQSSELSSPLFKVASNKEISPLLQLSSPKESIIQKESRNNVFVNNASKIMFNVSDSYNMPSQSRGSSPRVFGKGVYALFNRRQPMELDKFDNPPLQKKPSEERLPVIESPYASFQKRGHVKSNSAFQDSRGNFAFSTGNTLLKSESQIFPKKPSIKPFNPMVPRLDLFAEFPRAMPSSHQNTPRKYSNPSQGMLSNRTVSNNV